MLLLIVKGSREAAFAAAEAHSVSFWFETESNTKSLGYVETYLRVPSHFSAKIYDWFAEPTANEPFPDGTLLFFTERNDR